MEDLTKSKLTGLINEFRVEKERDALVRLCKSNTVSEGHFKAICRVTKQRMVEQGLIKDEKDKAS